MSVRTTNLKEYHDQYILAPREATTLGGKVCVFFKNQGLYKAMIITGLALVIITASVCIAQGIPIFNTQYPVVWVSMTSNIVLTLGAFFGYIHNSCMLQRLHPDIERHVNSAN